MRKYNVTYFGSLPGTKQVVEGLLVLNATDAFDALYQARALLFDDENIREAQWESFTITVSEVPSEAP